MLATIHATWFVSMAAAMKYFGKNYQSIHEKFRTEMLTKALEEKLRRREIVIGRPPLMLGCRYDLVEAEGRYERVTLNVAEAAAQKAEFLRERLRPLGVAAINYLEREGTDADINEYVNGLRGK